MFGVWEVLFDSFFFVLWEVAELEVDLFDQGEGDATEDIDSVEQLLARGLRIDNHVARSGEHLELEVGERS